MQVSGPFHRQAGAALVVGMILLLVLTLLAVSGMNTASTELVMAGNEQYRQNAFQAAEIGIEQALRNGVFNPGVATEISPTTAVPGGTDTYITTIRPRPLANFPMPAMWGSSWNSFSTFHFEVQSQGNSTVRNATSTHVQGTFVVVPFQGQTPPPLTGVTGLNAGP